MRVIGFKVYRAREGREMEDREIANFINKIVYFRAC